MTASQHAIMSIFRRYDVQANQMLFINNGDTSKLSTRQFDSAMQSLIDSGLVGKDRRRNSYFLTTAGYEVATAG